MQKSVSIMDVSQARAQGLLEGDSVVSVGDDDAVPDRHMDEDIMTGRPLHQGTDTFQVEELFGSGA
jgi:hypothetical protein